MNKTELKLSYEVCERCETGVPVIIVAAGSSTRMQGINKQFLEIHGIPVIARTLLAFENCKAVKNIILVVRDEDIFALQLLAEKYMITKLSDIVCGGKTRQESVLKGFSRLGEEESLVLIHDGARPFVNERIINDTISALEKHSAVTCAVKVKDTIKQIDQNGCVIKTLERGSLVAVQTPQGVRINDYMTAVEKVGNVTAFTDDTSIMETAGYTVAIVNGDYNNIKITTPEDIAIAEGIIKSEDSLCE